MGQGRLFPLMIVRTEPAPDATAMCRHVGQGEDGHSYFLKTQAAGLLVPASEFLCTKLAIAVGLAAPEPVVAQFPNGEFCFASRQEAGVLQQERAMRTLLQKDFLPRYVHHLARWFAFDLFAYNNDRHCYNFLLREAALDPVLLGIDFGHAFLAAGQWPLPPPPLTEGSNTTRTQRRFAQQAPYPRATGAALAARLLDVPDNWLPELLDELPESWMDARLKRTLHCWWRGNRRKRLKLIRNHLANGRYLQLCAHPRSA